MQTLTTGKKTCILRLVAFQARVTMGTSVGISNEKALGIIWGNRKNKNSSTNAASEQLWLFVHPVHSNCTAAAFLFDWRFFYWILSLKTIPSPIALVIRTQLPAPFGNGQLQIIPWNNEPYNQSESYERCCNRQLSAESHIMECILFSKNAQIIGEGLLFRILSTGGESSHQ